MAQTTMQPRRPLDTQRNLGGDMSMMFFVRPQLPRKFSSPDQQLVKGLNVETIAFVDFAPPPWLEEFHYSALVEQSNGEPSKGAYFSLNVSVYNRPLVTSDWEDLLFFFNGRVHPYALTWEVTSTDDAYTSDETQNYTIPAIIVRDNGYYPHRISVAGRMFDNLDELPLPSPIVTFTGPILGPGTQLLLDNDSISGIDDNQRKCCGFVQLSTFITPREPVQDPVQRLPSLPSICDFSTPCNSMDIFM